jgi:hypothetical protein
LWSGLIIGQLQFIAQAERQELSMAERINSRYLLQYFSESPIEGLAGQSTYQELAEKNCRHFKILLASFGWFR